MLLKKKEPKRSVAIYRCMSPGGRLRRHRRHLQEYASRCSDVMAMAKRKGLEGGSRSDVPSGARKKEVDRLNSKSQKEPQILTCPKIRTLPPNLKLKIGWPFHRICKNFNLFHVFRNIFNPFHHVGDSQIAKPRPEPITQNVLAANQIFHQD